MKKLYLILILFPVIFSCEKQVDFCNSKECQTYFNIWKDLFITRNQLTEAYFDKHVSPWRTTIDTWNDGISFRVEYKVKIDWAEANLSDQFIIWLDPSTAGLYPSIPAPRNTYLSKTQINNMLNIFAFSSEMHKVTMIERLKYASRKEAVKVLESASGVNNLDAGEVYYQNPSFNTDPGHPMLRTGATLNQGNNDCMSCNLDLVTGETVVRHEPCVIWYCFEKGTSVTLANGKSLYIEKVRINDKILSLNTENFSLEEDVVLKIDSVIHNNMIRISFSDGTINYNTADHPYFVKGKGWCSFKPAETFKKYNLKAGQLKSGDICFKTVSNKLTEVKIKTITENPGDVMTYNITRLAKNKSWFANGILVSTEEN
jgi:hypothetical protein